MRVINGNDYYDSAKGMDTDNEVVFVRNNRNPAPAHDVPIVCRGFPKLTLKSLHSDEQFQGFGRSGRPNGHGDDSWPVADELHIVFAGIYYAGLWVRLPDNHCGAMMDFSRPWLPAPNVRAVWSQADLADVLALYDMWVEEPKPGRFVFDARPENERVDLETYFTPTPLDNDSRDYVINNNIAVMASRRRPFRFSGLYNSDWSVNEDALKDIGFQRCLDPYTAYQELASFVGGVLPRDGNPMIEPSEADRAAMHGFDKTSFRRPPTKQR